MAMNVTPFVGTDNFDMATFNNMISQINNGVNSEIQTLASQLGVQIDSKAKIQAGSYVGTGTYGSANPNSLTFGFEPKLVIVWSAYQPSENYGLRPASNSTAWRNSFIYTKGQCRTTIYYNNNSYSNELSVVGNTFSWYTTSNNAPYGQLNQSGVTYEYFAIG